MNPQSQERLRAELQALSKIHPSLGGVSKAEQDGSVLVFEVAASPDLDMGGTKAKFSVVLSSSWPAKPPRVTLVSGKPSPGTLASKVLAGSGQQVHLPVLDEGQGYSRTYSLEVIFHSLRDLFRPRGAPDTPWDAARAPWLPGPHPGDLSGGSGGPGAGRLGLNVSHAGGQGRRRTMEDVALIRQGLAVPAQYAEGAAVLAIFDGHAGDECAQFAAKTLVPCLGERLERGQGWREALCGAMLAVDRAFVGDAGLSSSGAGCTACVVVFDGKVAFLSSFVVPAATLLSVALLLPSTDAPSIGLKPEVC